MCDDCWIKMQFNGKDVEEATEEDVLPLELLCYCPFCKQRNGKDFMKNFVLPELKHRLMGSDNYNVQSISEKFLS
jgi:hypothetical protein